MKNTPETWLKSDLAAVTFCLLFLALCCAIGQHWGPSVAFLILGMMIGSIDRSGAYPADDLGATEELRREATEDKIAHPPDIG